jgi:hypothetical protein
MEKVNLKKSLIFFATFILSQFVIAQSFNEDKTAFANFLKRMYMASAFEGVKVVDDYNHQYLISVLSLEKAKYNSNPSAMDRVAQVKAQSQANTFINGATISSDLIIRSTEKNFQDSTLVLVETIESIKQNAMGFTRGLELLANFENTDGKRMVYVFMREMKNR